MWLRHIVIVRRLLLFSQYHVYCYVWLRFWWFYTVCWCYWYQLISWMNNRKSSGSLFRVHAVWMHKTLLHSNRSKTLNHDVFAFEAMGCEIRHCASDTHIWLNVGVQFLICSILVCTASVYLWPIFRRSMTLYPILFLSRKMQRS